MSIPAHDKPYLRFAGAVLALYLSPLFLLGENAHIRVHDNMDSNIAWYKVLIRSGEWFGAPGSVIPQIMNGLDRNAFGTEFSGIVLLHALFPSMTAYALSQAIARIFAFIGMYVLLKDHFIGEEKGLAFIRTGVALAFAVTPFWPSGMLSTLGQPLALWAFLHIRHGTGTRRHWITLVLLPLYASLVLGFVFFLSAVYGLWLWDAAVKKRWNLRFLGSIALMGAVFALIEYRLLLSLVISGQPTSRDEFVSSRLGLWRCVRLTVKNFVLGHHHVMTVHTAVMLPVMLVVVYLLICFKRWRSIPHAKVFLLLFVFSFALSVWYAFWFHEAWQPLKAAFPLLNRFNFARFHFLRPLVLYLGFALACFILTIGGGPRGRALAKAAVLAQVIVLFAYHEEWVNRHDRNPSFKAFYAAEQFRDIRTFIGAPQETYRVASIGLHPAIAQYNGFYTLDSYNNFYPLEYKRQFRTIIRKELRKNKELRTYFDTWGNRCYLFVAELGKNYDYRKTSRQKIRNLELNTEAFRRLGGRYIFSSLPIRNAGANSLVLRKVFDHPDSAWRVYVYEAVQGAR